MKPLSATRRKSPSTGANTDCNKEKADNGKDAKQSSVKSRLAVCGSRFLSGVGAAAAATAVVSPLLVPPEIAKETASVLLLTAATFSAAAQNVGNRNKTEKLHRLQNNFTKLALCGFAFLTGTSEITEDMQRMDEINRVRPYVAKQKNRSTMTNCGSIGKRSLPTKSFRLKIWPTLRPKRRPRICKRP